MVTPRDAADVEAALEVCRRFGAPVLARGCGTSLTGQTVNGAVLFDFTRHMDRIAELAPMRHTRLRHGHEPGGSADQDPQGADVRSSAWSTSTSRRSRPR
ncbi:FAD-binding protein [Microbispora sp. NPDC046973]|uniref:FAD-binding protein n=1 Tax=Microbispora sp. NPDC046973 TaxID=3155022 RepID=UPI0033E0BCDD